MSSQPFKIGDIVELIEGPAPTPERVINITLVDADEGPAGEKPIETIIAGAARLAAALAITALCSACAPGASAAEIPHPPFTAERFGRFIDGPIFECLDQEVRKAKEVRRLSNDRLQRELTSTTHIADVSGVIKAENEDMEKLFSEENDCYLTAEIKWGIIRPLSAEQFEKMRDVLRKRCDKPQKIRDTVLRENTQKALKEMSEELNDIIAADDQCYRDVQTEWGFK